MLCTPLRMPAADGSVGASVGLAANGRAWSLDKVCSGAIVSFLNKFNNSTCPQSCDT